MVLFNVSEGKIIGQITAYKSERKSQSEVSHQTPHLRKRSGPPDPQALNSRGFRHQMRNVIKWVSSSSDAVLSLFFTLTQAWHTHSQTAIDFTAPKRMHFDRQ